MKRYQKNLLRLLCYTIILFFIIVVVLLFVPLHIGYISENIGDKMKTLIGTEVKFEDCVLYILPGKLVITQPRLINPENERNRFPIKSMEILFSLPRPFKWSEAKIKRIRIHQPEPLNFILKDNSVKLDEEVSFLEPLFSSSMARPKVTPFPEIIFNHVILNFSMPGQSEPIFSLRDTQISLRSSESELTALVKGQIQTASSAEFRSIVQYLPAAHRLDFKGQIDRLAVDEQQTNIKGLAVSANNLGFEGNVSVADLKGLEINISATDLDCREEKYNIYYQSPEINIALKATEEEDKLSLNLLNVRGHSLNLTAQGFVSYLPTKQFMLTVQEEEIPAALFSSYANSWMPRNMALELSQAEIKSKLSVQGGWSPLTVEPQRVEGEIKTVGARHESWPYFMLCERARFQLTPDEINLSECVVKTNDISLSFDAWLKTRAFLANVIDINSNWSFVAEASDLKETLFSAIAWRNKENIKEISLQGEISGEGVLSLDFTYPLALSLQTGNNKAELAFREVTVNHPSLPGEIKRLQGKIFLEPRELVFQQLAGELLQSSFATTGSLTGMKYFWQHPEVALELDIASSGRDLNRTLSRYLSKHLIPELTGEIGAIVQVKGPLDIPDAMSINTRTSVKDFAIRYNAFTVPVVLNNIAGDVEVKLGSGLKIKPQFQGFIWDFPFDLSGEMTERYINLSVDSFVDLASVRQVFLPYLKSFRMAGQAEVKALVNYQLPSTSDTLVQINKSRFLPSGIQTCVNLSREFTRLLGTPERWQNYITAKIEVKDGLFAHQDMPLNIHHINGPFDLRVATLFFKDVNLAFGEKTKEVVGSGKISFLPPAPGLVFQAWSPELHIEEWVEGWKPSSRPSKKAETLDQSGQGQLVSFVKGEVKAEHLYYHQFQGEAFEGKIEFENFLAAPSSLRYYDVKLAAYDGESKASGLVLFRDEGALYEVAATFNQLNLSQLLKAIGQEQTQSSGIVSGKTNLTGRGSKLENLKGEIAVELAKSRFIRHSLFNALGKLTHLTTFEDISFMDVTGNFTIAEGAVTTKNLIFNNLTLSLRMDGKAGFDKSLDFEVYLAILSPQLVEKVPLVRQLIKGIANIIDKIGKVALKFHLSGTLDNPRYEAVPLSVDEMLNVLKYFSRK